MNNILGQPVEGDDFFDRQSETDDLWESLQEGNHLLLLAPRRVGKTSLALRVGQVAIQHGWKFALADAQRDRDELGFLDNLFQNLKSAGVKVPLLARLTEWLTIARRTLRGKAEGYGLSIEFDSADGVPSTLEHQIERLFQEIEAEQDHVLIAVDELPMLLEVLESADPTGHRLQGFLNWFRALRLRYRKNIRWLLLGSVGLDTFAELRQLTAAINDLQPVTLGAYSEADAIAFLQLLGDSKGITLEDPLCRAVLAEIGWPLPFCLQLVVHELHARLGRPPRAPAIDDVSAACRELLSPQFYKHFEPWRGRLSEGLDADHHRVALAVLNTLCTTTQGHTRDRLLTAAIAKFPQRDPDEVSRLLATVLGQLERDGYLLKSTPAQSSEPVTYAFRSFLLRGYWHARELA